MRTVSKNCRRILHVNKLFWPDYTGEGVFIERLTPAMDVLDREIQHDLLAVHSSAGGNHHDRCTALRNVFYLGLKDRGFTYSYLVTIIFLLIKLPFYNILHFHSHVDRYFIITAVYKFFRRKVIYTATLTDSAEGLLNDYSPFFRKFAAKGIQLFDHYICISQRLYAETLPHVGPEKAVLIPIGIHIPVLRESSRDAERTSLGLDPNLPTLIFVGGICQRKDPLLLIKAVAALKERNRPVSLILVGPVLEPDYFAQMQFLIEQYELHSLVACVGESDNPNRYFAMADIMTFTSHNEGFGTVVIEAMAMGVPVIARRLPGVNEDFVLQGQTGFLFERDEDFLPLLEDLIADPRRQRRLGQAARAHVCKAYEMEKVAKRYLETYRSSSVLSLSPIARQWSREDSRAKQRFLAGGARCSAIDERTRVEWAEPFLDRPILLTTIDGEEEFDWTKPFKRANRSVSNMAHQEVAHTIFARYGIKPTYLITHPVADDPQASSLLKSWVGAGTCEIGVQLHPWVTPPFEEEVSNYNSFLGNLDIRLQFYKVKALTEAVEETFGVRPIAFRAGRYGLGHRTSDILRALRYEIDLSVVPHFDYSDRGGPAFWGAPEMPYWCDRSRHLLEVPLTSSMVGPLGARNRLAPILLSHPSQKMHLPGILARLGLLERIRLTPEGTTLEHSKRLVRARLCKGKKVFMISYHTPSLVPGSTPYARTQQEVNKILEWLDAFYSFFMTEMNGASMSVAEFNAFARKHEAGQPAIQDNAIISKRADLVASTLL